MMRAVKNQAVYIKNSLFAKYHLNPPLHWHWKLPGVFKHSCKGFLDTVWCLGSTTAIMNFFSLLVGSGYHKSFNFILFLPGLNKSICHLLTPAIVSGTLINVFTLPFSDKPRHHMIGLCSAMLTLEQTIMMKIKISKSRISHLI